MVIERTLAFLLTLCVGSATLQAQTVATATSISRMPSRLKPMTGDLQLGVVDGALLQVGPRTVLLGGMTMDFEASPAIQLRKADGSWMPVGNQMVQPRINPNAVALADGKVFVWGGFSGSARGELTLQVNGELLDPRVAGSSKSIMPPETAIPWNAPTAPVLLEDGTIALAAGDAVHRFDPRKQSWLAPLKLGRVLVTPSLCHLDATRLLVTTIDADRENTHLLEVDWKAGTVRSWDASIPTPVPGAVLHTMPDGRVIVLGWPGPKGHPSTRNFLLDPSQQTITEGPPLPHQKSGPGWFTSCRNENGILVLLTPDTSARSQTEAYLLRLEPNRELRAWQLTNTPHWRRQMLLARGSDGVELLGGYRFLSEADARLEGMLPGAVLSKASVLMEYGTGPIGD